MNVPFPPKSVTGNRDRSTGLALTAASVGRVRLFANPDMPDTIRGATEVTDFGQSNRSPANASVDAPQGEGFIAQPLVKGRLIHRRTKSWRDFMFNPTPIDFRDGWSWGASRVPGMSAPIIAGGSGNERPIQFVLYLDADRGRCHLRPRAQGLLGDSPVVDEKASLDLTSELNWYRMLTYPMAGRGAQAYSAPSTVIFTWGPLFPAVECVVDGDIGFTINQMTPSGAPTRAQIDMKLHRYVRNRVTTADFAMGSPYYAAPDGYEDGGQSDF